MEYFHVDYPPHQVITTNNPVQCTRYYSATNLKSKEEAISIMQSARVLYLEKMLNMTSSLHEGKKGDQA